MQFTFDRDRLYRNSKLVGRFRDGQTVDLIKQGTRAIAIRKSSTGIGIDLYSHPHPAYAAESAYADATVYQDFVQTLLQIKVGRQVSKELRAYILELVIDPGMLAQFVADPDEALAEVPIEADEKQILKDAVAGLQAKIEAFRSDKVVDDGDHFLLFPQTVDEVAPKAWINAAWPFIAHFRSNFGLYLGGALLYSRVTILGSMEVAPAVSEGEQAFLARQDWRAVERIGITSAKDLARVLEWGVAHDVNFGLGRVTPLILRGAGDDEILGRLGTAE